MDNKTGKFRQQNKKFCGTSYIFCKGIRNVDVEGARVVLQKFVFRKTGIKQPLLRAYIRCLTGLWPRWCSVLLSAVTDSHYTKSDRQAVYKQSLSVCSWERE